MWAGPDESGRGLHSTPQAGFSESCRARGSLPDHTPPPYTHHSRPSGLSRIAKGSGGGAVGAGVLKPISLCI